LLTYLVIVVVSFVQALRCFIHSLGSQYIFDLLSKLSVIKSKRLRWAGHVARMEKGRNAFNNMVTGVPTGK
jgi:hypothetical protein